MAYHEWPKTFYRYNEAGEREGKTFKAPEDVEATWLTWEEFAALPVPAPKNLPKSADPVAAGKRLAAAERENAALKDTVKLYEDNAKLDAVRLEASAARVAELEAFVTHISEDENCPTALKVAITGLFAPASEEDAPKPKRKAKA